MGHHCVDNPVNDIYMKCLKAHERKRVSLSHVYSIRCVLTQNKLIRVLE